MLNGKLVVEINEIQNSVVTLYMQPNNFIPEGLETIVENNKVYFKPRKGRYEVPSDWSIYVVYNSDSILPSSI